MPEIGCRTLVACGRQDSWAPLAQHEAMVALLPNVEFRIIENSGHMSTMEQPAQVTSLLRRWLLESPEPVGQSELEKQ